MRRIRVPKIKMPKAPKIPKAPKTKTTEVKFVGSYVRSGKIVQGGLRRIKKNAW